MPSRPGLTFLGPLRLLQTHKVRWFSWWPGSLRFFFVCFFYCSIWGTEAVQMEDWSKVILVPWMRLSSCPSIRGSHWLKFFSRPAEKKKTIKNMYCSFKKWVRPDAGNYLKQLWALYFSYQDGVAERLALLCWRGLWQPLGRSLPSASSVCQSNCPSGRWSQGNSGGLYLWRKTPPWCQRKQQQIFYHIDSSEFCPLLYLMVIIFLCMTAESSFFMRLMFPAHWNFSELMKKIGCFTRGKVSSSKGNIQASSAMPHLISRS